MTDLVLHQYARSPFSEKVRLVLGFKHLAWRAVEIPIVMPKPDVVALTGGYRRTPVLQIGADIYCDSALIVRVLDGLKPQPELYPPVYPLADALAQWADSQLFWTMIPVAMQPAGLAQNFAGTPPEAMKAFGADRAAMTAGMRRQTLADASVQLQTWLGRCDNRLADERPFLLGEQPCIADFSLAHNVWFVWRLPALAQVLAPHRHLLAWFERMRAFGHGERGGDIDSAQAIEIARSAEPAPAEVDPSLGFERGEPVTVAAIDYGTDPVAGTLAGLSRDEVAIARDDERAGRVVVHFPRIGFQIRRQEKTQ